MYGIHSKLSCYHISRRFTFPSTYSIVFIIDRIGSCSAQGVHSAIVDPRLLRIRLFATEKFDELPCVFGILPFHKLMPMTLLSCYLGLIHFSDFLMPVGGNWRKCRGIKMESRHQQWLIGSLRRVFCIYHNHLFGYTVGLRALDFWLIFSRNIIGNDR